MIWLAPLACGLIVLVVQVWLITAGTWTNWPGHGNLYDQLATSFRGGQLSLPETPDSRLLALTNPYDPAGRGDFGVQDASLYNGRYYTYFGPVPALLLVVFKVFGGGPVGDQYLVFGFIAGIFVVELLFIAWIRDRFFPTAPAWTLGLVVLTAGLTNPLLWALGTSTVYSAAIAAGTFFLLAGLLVALDAAAEPDLPAWKLLPVGLLWALSVGSRITQIVPVAFLAIGMLTLLALAWRHTNNRQWFLQRAAALLTFLVLGLGALAWYNWARFGSIFETGIKYQLAGVALQQNAGHLYSPAYILQNLYNYVLNTPRLKYSFPYFGPTRGLTQSVVPWVTLTTIYRTQELTGLLYNAPYLLLGVIPLIGTVRGRAAGEKHQVSLYTETIGALGGWFLIGAALFLSFFWAAERYLIDFLPPLFLLSIVALWQIDARLQHHRGTRGIYWATVALLLAAAMLVSILLCISFNADGFRQLDPVLWRQLSNIFRP